MCRVCPSVREGGRRGLSERFRAWRDLILVASRVEELDEVWSFLFVFLRPRQWGLAVLVLLVDVSTVPHQLNAEMSGGGGQARMCQDSSSLRL